MNSLLLLFFSICDSMRENRAEFETNIYNPTTWNKLWDHERPQSDEKLERQPTS